MEQRKQRVTASADSKPTFPIEIIFAKLNITQVEWSFLYRLLVVKVILYVLCFVMDECDEPNVG